MPVSICEQTVSFFACFSVGIIMAFFYDVYSALRHIFKIKKVVVFIFDSLFFLLLAIAFFAALYITCGGKLRWFVFAGLVFGLLIYIFGVSIYIRPVLEKQFRFLQTIFKTIFRMIFFPFLHILLFLRSIFKYLRFFVQSKLKKHSFFVKNTIEKLPHFIIKLLRYVIK